MRWRASTKSFQLFGGEKRGLLLFGGLLFRERVSSCPQCRDGLGSFRKFWHLGDQWGSGLVSMVWRLGRVLSISQESCCIRTALSVFLVFSTTVCIVIRASCLSSGFALDSTPLLKLLACCWVLRIALLVSSNKGVLLSCLEGAIWPSLSPCTVINPILLTYRPWFFVRCHPIGFVGRRFPIRKGVLFEHPEIEGRYLNPGTS